MKKYIILLTTIILSLSCYVGSANPSKTDESNRYQGSKNGAYLHTEDDINVYEHYSAGYNIGYNKGFEDAQADNYDKGYQEGFKEAKEKYELPESAFLKFINITGDFINHYFFAIVLIISIVLIIFSMLLNHIRRLKSFRAELDCKGISRYKIKVNEVDRNNTFYTNTAEVTIYTKITYTHNRYGSEEIEDASTHFFLNHFTWPNGQEVYLYRKTENGDYTYPEIHFNKPTTLYTSDNKEYTVILMEEMTKLSGEQIKEIHAEKEKIRRKGERVKKHIDKLLDDKTCQHEFFADIFADYKYNTYAKIADDLISKIPSAPKAAETVRNLNKELKTVNKKYRNLKYKLNMYGIKNIDDITLEDAKYLQAAHDYLRDTKPPKE